MTPRGRHRAGGRRISFRTTAMLGLLAATLLSTTASALATGTADKPAFTATITATRVNMDSGQDVPVEARKVTVTADRTTNLRDGDLVNIAWSGAHPTGGLIYDVNSEAAMNQEYPVAILECRGVDSSTVPLAQRLRPETCFTQTPALRYQFPQFGQFPPYRVDRYAAAADRTQFAGRPANAPAACPGPYDDQAERWVHFIGYDGHDFPGGANSNDCPVLAPEQSNYINPLAPPNTTFAASDVDGKGSARFIVQTADSNATLGCDRAHACSIVVLPIMGISCDAAGHELPTSDSADRPADADVAAVAKQCERTGRFRPGVQGDATNQNPESTVDFAVSGRYWWSASNWRNRVTIPLSFGVTSSVCSLVGGGSSEDIYGSEYVSAATQQWQPKFCLDKNLTPFQHVQVSDVQAKNLLSTSSIDGYSGVKAAFQAGPPQTPFFDPIVQAPTAVTAFSVSYSMDAYHGLASHEYLNLKLTPRLLAKALSESYPAYPALREQWAQGKKCPPLPTDKKDAAGRAAHISCVALSDAYIRMAANPISMASDPEFTALNPDMAQTGNSIPAATLFLMSSDADTITALTSYINADPDARAWLDGKADPWGMVVNPTYKGISLPVTSWPLLDNTMFDDLSQCYYYAATPILPLVAGPVSDPAQVSQNLLYNIANSQVGCPDPQVNLPDLYKRAPLGRENPPSRFIIGITALGDAARYQLHSAQLMTQRSATADPKMGDLLGYSFVGPTDDSIRAAAKLLTPDDSLGTWTLPYSKIASDPAAASAYPGTLLISTDVPTRGLPAVDAQAYAKFLRYAAGPGQTSGETPGTLAAGYLPITGANGLGSLAAYTAKAADAVQAQKGVVPFVSGKAIPQPPSSNPTASPPATTTGGSTRSSESAGPPSGPASDSSAPSTPSGGAKQTLSNSPVSVKPVSQTIATKAQSVGPLALLLPITLAVAVVAGAASLWSSGVGRR